MLKLEGNYKISYVGVTKNKKPFIKVVLNSWNEDKEKPDNRTWLTAQVFFTNTNVELAQIESGDVNYCEFGPHWISKVSEYINQKTQEKTYTLIAQCDYVRCYHWDREANKQPLNNQVNNDKIKEEISYEEVATEKELDPFDDDALDWDDDL